MNAISILDKYTVKFYKKVWSEEEIFTAQCLDMTYAEGYVIVDIRLTWRKSLGKFMKYAFPTLFFKNPAYMRKAQKAIRKLYDDEFNSFVSIYGKRLDYSKVDKQLRKYQIETIYRCIYSRRKLLALDMGTGKTITSATISRVISALRTAVIGPAIAKWNWYGDMTENWGFNQMNWTILEANRRKTMRAIKERFVVLNYEIIEKYQDYVNKDVIDHFIIDECHRAKNTSTKTFKGLSRTVKKHPNAKITLLTGTPITNRVTDLYAYLKLCGHPLGKNKKAFEDRYAVKTRSKIIGVKNVDELNLRLSNFMIRLKSDDVLELPKLTISRAFFNLGELDNEYNEIIMEMKRMREEYDNMSEKERKSFKIMSQINSSISSLSRIAAMSKIDEVYDWAKSMNELGEKVVIFSSFTGPLIELEKKFGEACVRVDGSVKTEDKMNVVNRFKNEDKVTVFLGQVRAAGEVINLQNARTIMLIDVPVSPKDIEQPIKRCHRGGQERPVHAYFAIAKGTIDERLYGLIRNKTGDINSIVDVDTKRGVIDYGDLPELLFKELTN